MKIKNDILLRTLNGASCERPPVWLMRQAGRILPQYRAVRNNLSGFKELVTTPSLAAEVTIQPVEELDVDAAILFSDILVIPEAMGLDYEMVAKKGPFFPKVIKGENDIKALDSGQSAADKLGYVYDAISETKKNLAGRVPLIGFSGAPWTLMAYMVEGGGSKTFSKARRMLFAEPALSHRILEKITETIIAYLQSKVKAGVNAVQIFDSWAGVLSTELYKEFCIPYLKRISESIQDVPVILFAKDAWFAFEELADIPNVALGMDWTMDPAWARNIAGPEKVLQGNLDPCILYSDPVHIHNKARQMISAFGTHHVANLGHGVYPDTPLEGVKAFVNSVKSFRYELLAEK